MKVYGKENCRAPSELTFYDWLSKVNTNKLKHKVSFGVASVRPERKSGPDVEVDFVLIGEAGVLAIEVKGGIITIDSEGTWQQNNREISNPFIQSMDNFHSLMDYLVAHKALRSKTGYYACAFPDMAINEPMTKSYPSTMYIDNRFAVSPEVFIDGLYEYNHEKHGVKKVTPAEADNIKKLLVPNYEYYVRDMATYTDDAIMKLSEEQVIAIEGLRDVKRLIIDGPPGSGKTVVALEILAMKELEGVKTLYVCYNKALRNKIEVDITKKIGSEPNHVLIRTMEEVKKLGTNLFELAVLDETQDYLDIDNFEHIDRVLEGGVDKGLLRIFIDTNQDIFNHTDQDYLNGLISRDTVVPYHLKYNYRNTSNIINVTKQLTNLNPGEIHGNPVGLDVGLVRIPYADIQPDFDQYAKLISIVVNSLLDGGFEPKDIMIITLNPLQRSALSDSYRTNIKIKNGVKLAVPQNINWSKDLNAQGILYGSPYILKGLDSRVVVCLDFYDPTKQKEALVSLTRARSKLIIFVGNKIHHKNAIKI